MKIIYKVKIPQWWWDLHNETMSIIGLDYNLPDTGELDKDVFDLLISQLKTRPILEANAAMRYWSDANDLKWTRMTLEYPVAFDKADEAIIEDGYVVWLKREEGEEPEHPGELTQKFLKNITGND